MQSVVRLKRELKLCTPGYANLLHRRKAKKASVNAAQILKKSRIPSQLCRMGGMANKTLDGNWLMTNARGALVAEDSPQNL